MDHTLSCYQPLLPGRDRIRLLRLLPNESGNAPIQCQLFNYTLEASGRRTHPYDALSYVWGDQFNPEYISIGRHQLLVTQNLYKALLRLRHHTLERILWVDAVCINQSDILEKEEQIQFMAKIYAQANRVVVWLGEEADDSDQALEEIRVAGRREKSFNYSSPGVINKAALALLQRPWFRRIWVLQEVAAARHVLIMCGSAEIDGYAFCLGVGSLNFYNTDLELQSIIRSVTYLIRGSIFRPGYAMNRSGNSSLDICPLGELIDMYHTHEATEPRDKVFALLGMSNDNLNKASLSPNYRVPWEELLQNLIKFLLYDKISIETLGGKQIVLIKSKGYILGKVSLTQSDIAWDDSPDVDVIFYNTSKKLFFYNRPKKLGYEEGRSTPWTLHNSANSIRDGDLVCLLQGASKPTIIRSHDDHFDIIIIAATLLEQMLQPSQSLKTFSQDFWLIWDWEKLSREGRDLEHETLLQTKNWASESSKIGFKDHLGKAARSWKAAMILEDSADYEKAQEKRQEAIDEYEAAAVDGHQAKVKHLLETGEVDINFKHEDGTTPLWWAAKKGYNTMVKLLLGTGQVNIDSKHKDGTTPLWWAAKGGYLAVVERLLKEKAKVNVAAESYSGRTALQAAAEGGHLAVVERLLEEKAEVNAAAAYDSGRTAIQAAAGGGHLAVVKRLLEEKAEVNAQAAPNSGRTALQAAAGGGHLAVVERLLEEKAKVNAEAARYGGRTALQAAAEGGHLAVVERLLEEKAEVNAEAKLYWGRTALQAAAEGGYLAVVERLLEEKAEVNAAAASDSGRTALQAAAEEGHLAVVERLLEEKAEVNAQAAPNSGRTALQAAAGGGHLAVVERLFEEKAEVNAAASYDSGRTAIQAAAGGGHLAIVERLLEEKAEVNAAKLYDGGRTALQAAAEGGYLAVVERLLKEKAEVNAEAVYFSGRTALQAAAGGGHLAVVKRLLDEKAEVNAEAARGGGRTALQAAAEGGHLAVVERLLKEKAEVNAEAAEHWGMTALQAAKSGGYTNIIECLYQAGAIK